MKSLYFIIVFCLNHVLASGQLPNCDLKKQADGISVYTCLTGNKKFKTLKAEFVLQNTTITELRNFLLQVDNYPSWQYNTINAEVLQKISDTEIIYLSQVNAPWPVSDREILANFKISSESTEDQMQIDINSFSNTRPVREGLTRVTFIHGLWKVVRIKDNLLKIEYTLDIDPGGAVPAWLVNMAMAEGPYVSFKNLKQQLEK